MASYYDEDLHRLHQETLEKKGIEAMLSDLQIQKEELEKKSKDLEKSMNEEQEDVERLNKGSLTAFFYRVSGKLEEKLTKEEEEARAAAIKWEAAKASLQSVNEDIARYQSRLLELENCDTEYETALAEKMEAIKSSETPEAEKILQLERNLTFFETQEKEIDEAISAGERALQIAREVLDELGGAQNWGIVDMAGGDLIADVIKYSHLNTAQSKINSLQLALRRFRTELSDVSKGISGDIRVEVGDFLYFADYFFDDLFTDWMVYGKIKNAKEKARQTRVQLENALENLNQMKEEFQSRQAQAKKDLEQTALDLKL